MSDLVETRSLSREVARVGVDRAVEVSRAMGRVTCIAVLDSGGHLVSFDRMDGAPFQTIQLAQDKAYWVAGTGTSNDGYWDMIKDEPWLVHGVQKIKGLVVLGGGLPVVHDGELLGAVGVSGRSSMAEDRAIAEAAVTAILERLRST